MNRIWPPDTKVLVVEDDFLTAHLLRSRLQMVGITTLVAENGREALDILVREPVTLIITDLMMPAMNGFRLVQEVRELPSAQSTIPILVISANQNEQDIVDCFQAGADDFMSKPISFPLLMERLWRLIQRDRG